MQKLFSIIVVLLAVFLTVPEVASAEAEWGRPLADGRVFGEGVSQADTVLVSSLLANPEAWVGKVIRIEGVAVGVCAHRGCWVNVASDVEGDLVRVKVTDGEIVFPPEILGDIITAEGVWTANKLDLETTKKVCSNKASEKGESFDPNSVTSCMTVYQLTGTGAVTWPAPAVSEPEPETKNDEMDG